MAFNERVAPRINDISFAASIATNASAIMPGFVFPYPGQVVGAYILNSSTAAITSGTTTGSAVTITLYKNGSNAGSIVGSFNGSGTTVATQATQALTLSTSTALLRFATGDTILGEFTGGAANNASNAGAKIVIHYILGLETGATPSAGTGPA